MSAEWFGFPLTFAAIVLLIFSTVALWLEKAHSKKVHEQNWQLRDRVFYLEKRLEEATKELP